MNPPPWWTVRVIAGAAVLAAVLWWTGIGPIVDGLRAIDAQTLLVGAVLGSLATVACAWRWRLVAHRLGLPIGRADAVAACYRAQFLNLTLPGGILGDVYRGVRHGRQVGGAGRGLRAVAWERFAGQAVQCVLVGLVLLLAPSPVRPGLPAPLVLLLVGCVAAASVVLLRRRFWLAVVLTSTVAHTCHVATYLVAARAVGVTTPVRTLLPLVLLVLLAAAIPVGVAGWGPREGMAAWAFAAAGLGAAPGVAASAAFAVIVLVANLPGAVVLAGRAAPQRRVAADGSRARA